MRSIWVASVVGALFVSACGSPDEQSYFVEGSEAAVLAQAYLRPLAAGHDVHAADTAQAIRARDGLTALHLVRLEEGGFAVVSADRRVQPILAYSAEDIFPANVALPSSLETWLDDAADIVAGKRRQHAVSSEAVERQWSALSQRLEHAGPTLSPTTGAESWMIVPNEEGGYTCGSVVAEDVGPLLSTRWGQGCGFNNYAPTMCGNNYCGGHALTGCNATAAAQVMRYFTYPLGYGWDIMPDSLYHRLGADGQDRAPTDTGSTEISAVMRDIGVRADTTYGCAGSFAFTTTLADAMRSFGFTATHMTFDASTVMSELRARRPVILGGNGVDGGHTWITDGFRSVASCDGTTSVALHMNWGWDGYADGYYEDFQVAGYDFSAWPRMIAGIQSPSPTTQCPPGQCCGGNCASQCGNGVCEYTQGECDSNCPQDCSGVACE